MLSNLIILIIKLYKYTFSLVLPNACRYNPSCSDFMIISIKKFGAIKGIFNGMGRILRCHPFSKNSTWDPV